MKKSNWLIVGLFVVASVIFLAMWYVMGFNLIDDPLDLVISIVWWVVIIAICLLIQWSENKRQRSIRTTLLAPGVLYNPEVGVVQVAPGQTHAQTLERILSNLTYGFDTEENANEQHIRFKQIVRSKKFANDGDTWTGEVVDVANPNQVRYFQNKAELARLIDVAWFSTRSHEFFSINSKLMIPCPSFPRRAFLVLI